MSGILLAPQMKHDFTEEPDMLGYPGRPCILGANSRKPSGWPSQQRALQRQLWTAFGHWLLRLAARSLDCRRSLVLLKDYWGLCGDHWGWGLLRALVLGESPVEEAPSYPMTRSGGCSKQISYEARDVLFLRSKLVPWTFTIALKGRQPRRRLHAQEPSELQAPLPRTHTTPRT